MASSVVFLRSLGMSVAIRGVKIICFLGNIL